MPFVSIQEILTGDKGVELSNGYWVRPFTLPAGWQRARFGFRATFPVDGGAAVFLTGSPGFFFGLTDATSCPGRDPLANVGHALYCRSNLSSFVYSSIGCFDMDAHVAQVVNGVESSTALSGNMRMGAIDDALDTKRAMFIMDVAKGSPWSVQLSRCHGTGEVDVGYDALTYFMEYSGDPSSSLAAYRTNVTTHTIDEGTNGAFTRFFVSWDRTYPVCQVSEVLCLSYS